MKERERERKRRKNSDKLERHILLRVKNVSFVDLNITQQQKRETYAI